MSRNGSWRIGIKRMKGNPEAKGAGQSQLSRGQSIDNGSPEQDNVKVQNANP
jgi:hypothetical protein